MKRTGGAVQNKAIRYAKSIGLMVRRNYMGPGAETGWPDVEFFFPRGKVLFIEFKAPGEPLRKRQEFIIAQLRERGHTVHVCDSYEDAKEAIDRFFRQELGYYP
ncbi:MAG: VRR-NUC domain-containing protein [Pigmentiphaga sp.]|nr:VRR-NUC domain-containing protein [Pigmentiphaga sp.]